MCIIERMSYSPMPTTCPNGHQLGPNRVLRGYNFTTRGRRTTWQCTTCWAVIIDGDDDAQLIDPPQ